MTTIKKNMKKDLPNQKNSQGFTLIELLVAITIVAVMAAVGIVVFSSMQQRARDSKRSQDLNAIAGALEGNKLPGTIFYRSLSNGDFAGGAIPVDPRVAAQKYCFWGKTNVPPQAPPVAPVLTSSTEPVDWISCARTGFDGYSSVVGVGIPTEVEGSKITSWTICAKKESEADAIECKFSKL